MPSLNNSYRSITKATLKDLGFYKAKHNPSCSRNPNVLDDKQTPSSSTNGQPEVDAIPEIEFASREESTMGVHQPPSEQEAELNHLLIAPKLKRRYANTEDVREFDTMNSEISYTESTQDSNTLSSVTIDAEVVSVHLTLITNVFGPITYSSLHNHSPSRR